MSSKSPNLKLKGLAIETSGDNEEEYDTHNKEFDLGLSLDKLNIGPHKKLLILCLGGLLVHRVNSREKRQVNHHPYAKVGNYRVYKRPFCNEFLKFCLERFEVGLWSSAKEHNFDSVLSMLMEGMEKKLLFIWDQDECTNSGFKCLENKYKPIFLKDLTKVWKSYAKYSSSNTLMLDDEPYKSLINPPNTAIFPASYKVQMGDDHVLAPNGELWKFMEGLVDAGNVQSYVNEHRIGQAAITESHSDWDFYLKIIKVSLNESLNA